MKILIVSGGDDVGGVAIAIQRAFERYGGEDWTVRSIRGTNNYIDYPEDIPWDISTFRAMWEWADVIHSMEKLDNLTYHFNPPNKPIVLHHHGTIYRDAADELNRVADRENIVQICSTIDLTALSDNVVWLPNPIDIKWMECIRHQYKPRPGRDQVTFVHTPTQRWAKHSDLFIGAARKTGHKIITVEGKPWYHALAKKAGGDIYLDQLYFGYGLAGLEAMAMKMPVVGGAEQEGVRDLIKETIGYIPYYEASIAQLAPRLQAIADNPIAQAYYSNLGYQYVYDYHAQRLIVDALKNYYAEARERFVPRVEPWP